MKMATLTGGGIPSGGERSKVAAMAAPSLKPIIPSYGPSSSRTALMLSIVAAISFVDGRPRRQAKNGPGWKAPTPGAALDGMSASMKSNS
jgi:hypothetical protein